MAALNKIFRKVSNMNKTQLIDAVAKSGNLKKKDAEAEAEVIDIQPVKVEVERKERKKRPTKKR